jgi:hypothetical protein
MAVEVVARSGNVQTGRDGAGRRADAAGHGAPSTSFVRFGGVCALAAGVAGFLYAVSFVVLRSDALSGLFLLAGGLLTTAVFAALYEWLRPVDAPLARWAASGTWPRRYWWRSISGA